MRSAWFLIRVSLAGRRPAVWISMRKCWDGARERVLTDIPYIIAYRVEGNSVVILRVIHTSRK
jgi:plasmid stabilization system protein ParE